MSGSGLFLAPRVAPPFRLLECAIHTHAAKVTMKKRALKPLYPFHTHQSIHIWLLTYLDYRFSPYMLDMACQNDEFVRGPRVRCFVFSRDHE